MEMGEDARVRPDVQKRDRLGHRHGVTRCRPIA